MKYRLFLALLLVLFNFQFAIGQTVYYDLPETNGEIKAMEKRGDTVYLGGSFTTVYPANYRYGVKIAANDALSFHNWPKPDGRINIAISDGANGVFLGGYFGKMGDSIRTNLAHIDSAGVVSSLFGQLGANAEVFSMSKMGDTLYVGGRFSAIKYYISSSSSALVSVQTGLPNLNFPETNNSVLSSTLDKKGGLYLGGTFTTVGGVPRSNLAFIDSLHRVGSFNHQINGAVEDMFIFNDVLYLGGRFTLIDNQVRNHIAAIDLNTDSLLSWNPNVNNDVYCMHYENNQIYFGGNFTLVNGQPRNYAACVNLNSGAINNWNPNVNGIFVNSILKSGSRVYLGGDFTMVNGFGRTSIAAVDTLNGIPLSWSPTLFSPSGGFRVVFNIVEYDSLVFFSGNFATVNLNPRNNFAAVRKDNGAVTNWNPAANGTTVNGLFLRDSVLYVSGLFTSILGKACLNSAALNLKTWLPTNWAPNSDKPILTISSSNSTMFIGGGFSNIGLKRDLLAAIQISTGVVLPWTANLKSTATSGDISFLFASSINNTLYVKGNYQIGSTITSFAGFNMTTGNSSWTPTFNSVTGPNKLITYGDTLFMGGDFTTVNSSTRNGFAAFDLSMSHALLGWAPAGSSTVTVSDLLIKDSLLIVAGNFSNFGSLSRLGLAEINLKTHGILPWNPTAAGVSDIALINDTLYIAGGFSTVNGLARNKMAGVHIYSGTTAAWKPFGPNFSIQTLTKSGNGLYVGGTFTLINGFSANRFAAFNIATGQLLNWQVDVNNTINAINISNGKVYLGGSFTTINGLTRNRLGAIDLANGTLSSWNPNANNIVYTFLNFGNSIFVGGVFTTIGGTSRPNLASINASSGSLNTWNATVSGPVNALAYSNGSLFAGGGFTQIGGISRQYLGAMDINTGALSSFIASPNSAVNSLAVEGDTLYLGGTFDLVKGVAKNRIAGVQISNGNLLPFRTFMGNGNVLSIVPAGNRIYIAGNFSSVGSRNIYDIAAIDKFTGNATAWRADTKSTNLVNKILIDKGKLYAAGVIETINDSNLVSNTATLSLDTLSITLYNTSYPAICNNVPFTLAYSVLGNFLPGNVFTVQISNTNSQVFTSPIDIGSKTGTGSGTITVSTPSNTPPDAYRVRIISSYPSVIGHTNTLSSGQTNFLNLNSTAVTLNVTESSICKGDSQLIYTTNGTGLTYQWLKGSSILNSTNDSIYLKQNGKYNVIITNGFGCKDSSSIVNLNIDSIAVPSLNYIGDTAFCAGKSTLLYTDSNNNYSYKWYRNGSLISGSTNPSYTPNSNGTYFVRANTSSNCAASSKLQSIAIFSLPNTTVSVSKTNICLNDTSLLTASIIAGNTYAWSRNGQSLAGANSNIYKAFESGNYRAIITNSNSCIDSSTIKSVSVQPLPNAIIDSVGPTKFCMGNSVILSTDSSVGLSYKWFKDGVLLSGAIQKKYTATTNGNYSVVLTTATYSCRDTSKQVLVSVLNKPLNGVNQSGSLIFCKGGNVILTAVDQTLGNKYNWLFNNSLLNGDTLKDKKINQSGTYRLLIQNSLACIDTSLTFTTQALDTPHAEITVNGSPNFCSGSSVNLSVSTASGNAFKWFKNGSLLTGGNNVYTANSSGSYYNVTTNSSMCSDTSSSVILTALAKPILTPIVGPVALNLPSVPVKYSINAGSGFNYNWSIDKGVISLGQQTNEVTVSWNTPGIGNIKVVVSNADNCFDSVSAKVNINSTNVKELYAERLFKIYPNPVSDKIFIQGYHKIDSLCIRDLSGKVILELALKLDNSLNAYADVSTLPAGMYLLEIRQGDSFYYERLLKLN